METVRPLAVESFSDSWLSNGSLTNLIESDDELAKADTSYSFDFDTFRDDQGDRDRRVKFVHADEIFANGLIKAEFSCTGLPDFDVQPLSGNGVDVDDVGDAQMGCNNCCLFRRRRRVLSERIFQRVFGFFRRTEWRKSKKGSTNKVDDIDRRTLEIVKSFDNSPLASPGPSTVYHDLESSIHEAVLHCKRSIGR